MFGIVMVKCFDAERFECGIISADNFFSSRKHSGITFKLCKAEHESSGHLYITRVPGITPEQRNEIITKMAEQGVACNVHYKPLPMHTAYKKLGFDIKNYPNAYAHFANEITLPLHTCLTDEDVAYVIEKYTEILKEYI